MAFIIGNQIMAFKWRSCCCCSTSPNVFFHSRELVLFNDSPSIAVFAVFFQSSYSLPPTTTTTIHHKICISILFYFFTVAGALILIALWLNREPHIFFLVDFLLLSTSVCTSCVFFLVCCILWHFLQLDMLGSTNEIFIYFEQFFFPFIFPSSNSSVFCSHSIDRLNVNKF